MVRLNRGIALRRNTPEPEGSGLISKNVTFFGLLGATMAALKLKEQWDDYRTVPTDPTAANNPLAPPAYRDDDCDTESAIGLDTSINMPTRTKRKRNCCVCCGINCGLFCKALGIVILIFTVWNSIKFAKWMLTPSPTGLENMPEYSKSLGCLDANHFYQDSSEGTFYTVALGIDAVLELIIDGGAVGTVLLKASPTFGEEAIKVHANVRTSDSRLLSHVEVHTPASSPLPPSSMDTSYFRLDTPIESYGADACMRYDLTVYLPPTLHTLRISSTAVSQVKVDFDDSASTLNALLLDLSSISASNLVLTSEGLVSDNVEIAMRGGYLVGTLPIVNSTRIDTRSGDAVTKLSLVAAGHVAPPSDNSSVITQLNTISGTGRTDFTYNNRVAGRAIRSEHVSHGGSVSELRLTYAEALFNGEIDFQAQSYFMRNVQSEGFSRPGESREMWFGDKEGGDFLKVISSGWVGLYF